MLQHVESGNSAPLSAMSSSNNEYHGTEGLWSTGSNTPGMHVGTTETRSCHHQVTGVHTINHLIHTHAQAQLEGSHQAQGTSMERRQY